jgi:hypothetical protein
MNTEELARYFVFLDELRESGEVNMFGAGLYLAADFSLSRHDASDILSKWMKTFDEGKSAKERAELCID